MPQAVSLREAILPGPGEPVALAPMDDLPRPEGWARVRLVAAELAPLDLQIAAGEVPAQFPLRPGGSAVAKVEASERLPPGRLVFVLGGAVGMGRRAPGTLADRLDIPEHLVAPLPDGLDPVAAAVGVIPALTASCALHRHAELTAGERVLVLGATGAVGSAVAALAARAGAEVLAACRRPGAYTGPGTALDLADLPGSVADAGGADVIVDLLAGPHLDAAVLAGAPGCRHVLVGYAAGRTSSFTVPLTMIRQHRLLGFNLWQAAAGSEAQLVGEVMALLADGLATPEIAVQLPLDQVEEAYRTASGTAGRVVVTGESR